MVASEEINICELLVSPWPCVAVSVRILLVTLFILIDVKRPFQTHVNIGDRWCLTIKQCCLIADWWFRNSVCFCLRNMSLYCFSNYNRFKRYRQLRQSWPLFCQRYFSIVHDLWPNYDILSFSFHKRPWHHHHTYCRNTTQLNSHYLESRCNPFNLLNQPIAVANENHCPFSYLTQYAKNLINFNNDLIPDVGGRRQAHGGRLAASRLK